MLTGRSSPILLRELCSYCVLRYRYAYASKLQRAALEYSCPRSCKLQYHTTKNTMPLDPIIAGNVSCYLGKDASEVASSVFRQLARANTQNRSDASTSVAEAQVGFGRLGRSRRNTRRQRRDAAAPYSRHGMLQHSISHSTGQGNSSLATQPLSAHAAATAGEPAGDKVVSHEVRSETRPSSTCHAELPDAKQTVGQQ